MDHSPSPHGAAQPPLPDILADAVDIDSGYAVITVRSGQDIYVYGSVIDNATDDPTAIPMKGGNGSGRQWIAAAAHSSGAHGSVWRTDVCLLNRSNETASSGDHLSPATTVETRRIVLDLAAGQQIVIGDVVSHTGYGRLGCDRDRLRRSSAGEFADLQRECDGTFGLFLDGVSVQGQVDGG